MAFTLTFLAGHCLAQAPPRPAFASFDVATIKKMDPGPQSGRYIKMEGTNRFIEKSYTVKGLIAAAYDLNPETVVGGPAWMGADHFDIEARTPGDVRPTHDEQMRMLRALLVERFGLTFHREPREYSVYAMELAKGGAKLKPTDDAAQAPMLGPGVVYPDKVVLPARNATVGELASLLQRAIVDRPVLDKTGLTARYDFDLAWAPNESEFGGDVPKASETAPSLPLFAALEEQLGLKLHPMRGPVDALIVDAVARPTEN